MARRLLARGCGITALVRRTPDIRGNDGKVLPARGWSGAPPEPGELLVAAGDVALPSLGLAQGDAAAVAAGHDLLVHCAAATGFGLDEQVYRSVNIGGTRHALQLARAGGMAFLHVSTAYVCGDRDGLVPEGELAGSGFANGYEASKAEAERAVRAAGIPFAVARPSIVLGEWADGTMRSFDTTYAAFRLMAEGRVRVIPAAPQATLDFVPIDHVAGGLADLVERIDEAAGRTFHLASRTPIPVAEFIAAIAAFPHLRPPRIEEAAAFDPASLPAAERRLHARITGFYDSYFRRAPIFDDANLQALSGRVCPPTGRAYVERLIAYCLRTGFLRPTGGQVRRASAPP